MLKTMLARASRSLDRAARDCTSNQRSARSRMVAISPSLSESIESRSTSAVAYCGCRKIGQRVDRALQDVGGGEGVDLLRSLGAADVRIDHRALDRLGRPALVPQEERQFERLQDCGRRRGRTASVGLSLPSMLSGSPTTSPERMFSLDEHAQAVRGPA